MALAACLFAVSYVQPPVPLSSRSAVVRSSTLQMGAPGMPAGTSGKVQLPPPLSVAPDPWCLPASPCGAACLPRSISASTRTACSGANRRARCATTRRCCNQPSALAPRSRPCLAPRFRAHAYLAGSRVQKAPLKVLTRLESLGLLTSLSEAGLLSSAEASGLFSKLEAAGAFSAAEKLLPLADKLNVFSTLEGLLLVDSSALLLAALALLAGEVGLITYLPDDNSALVAVQVVTGVLAGAGATTLLAASALFGTLQSKN